MKPNIFSSKPIQIRKIFLLNIEIKIPNIETSNIPLIGRKREGEINKEMRINLCLLERKLAAFFSYISISYSFQDKIPRRHSSKVPKIRIIRNMDSITRFLNSSSSIWKGTLSNRESSTSNTINNITIKKKRKEKGTRLLSLGSNPHSKALLFSRFSKNLLREVQNIQRPIKAARSPNNRKLLTIKAVIIKTSYKYRDQQLPKLLFYLNYLYL